MAAATVPVVPAPAQPRAAGPDASRTVAVASPPAVGPVPARSAAPASARGTRACRVLLAGRLGYDEGLALQDRLVGAVREGATEALVLCEHEPVVTLGRSADARHLMGDESFYAARGIALRASGRGGDVTWHGPGQVVGYPILRLAPDRLDLHRYLRDLEEVILRAVADLGVRGARRVAGLTGVWAGEKKLAALGVRVSSGWITSHGFALNVDPDLAAFDLIVPCGIRGRGVTSLARLLGAAPPPPLVCERLALRFGEVFGRTMEPATGEVPPP